MNKHMIRIIGVVLATLFFFSPPVFADVNVLVIPKMVRADFWNIVGEGAQKAGNDLGISVTWRGPTSEDQRDAQIQIIEYGITRKFDAIVLAPNHINATAEALKKAVSIGIKIVLIDSDMETRYQDCLVESDNYKAGQMAANHLARLVGDEGKVVLARHIKNHASTNDREQGFMDTIKLRYPGLEIVADPYVGASIGLAYHTMSGLIDQTPVIDAIFSVGEMATLGTLRALKNKGLQGRIKFIGFDFNAVIMDAILSHEMDAAIVQAPFQMGYMGVKMAYQLIKKETVPKKIFTDTILLTAENYKTDKVKDIVSPYLRSHH